jgi:hypothetical protein
MDATRSRSAATTSPATCARPVDARSRMPSG